MQGFYFDKWDSSRDTKYGKLFREIWIIKVKTTMLPCFTQKVVLGKSEIFSYLKFYQKYFRKLSFSSAFKPQTLMACAVFTLQLILNV